MVTDQSRAKDGLVYRAILALPGILAFGVFLYAYNIDRSLLNAIPVFGSLVAVALGFSVPSILTQGFNKTIPSSKRLALWSRETERVVFFVVLGSFAAPSVIRLLKHM